MMGICLMFLLGQLGIIHLYNLIKRNHVKHSIWIYPRKLMALFTLTVCIISLKAFSQTNENVTIGENQHKPVDLKQVLEVSFNRLIKNNQVNKLTANNSFKTSNWLAAPASLQLGLLKSQEVVGSDETEISLNLPFNSNFTHKINDQLSVVNKQIVAEFNQLLLLRLSGIIRELVWDQKIAIAQQEYYNKKLSILTQLENNSEKLFAAGESSDYGLLVVQNEKNNTRIELLSNQKEQLRLQKHYQNISGLTDFPVVVAEPILGSKEFNVLSHPSLKSLEHKWKQQQLMIQSQSGNAEPWNLSLTAKKLDSPNVSEDQVGFSFEIPLTFSERNNQSNKNSWIQAKQQFDIDYQKTVMTLQNRIDEKQIERQYLLEKSDILQDSVKLSRQIMQKLDGLKTQNEIGQEVVLRRVLQALSIQNESDISKILLQKNNAMSRQVLGMTL